MCGEKNVRRNIMNQILRRFRKGVCTVTAFACVFANLLPVTPALAQEEEAAMGRYLETQVQLPEEFFIRDIVRTSEGCLRMIGTDEEGYAMYDSRDGGVTWEKAAGLSEVSGDDYFLSMILNPVGGGAGILLEGSDDGGAESEDDLNCSFVSFDAEGNTQKTPMDDGIGMILRFSGQGQLLGLSYNSGVSVLDGETGEISSTITSATVDMIGACGNEVLLLGESELLRYDMTTGEPIMRDDALDEALYAQGGSYMVATTFGTAIAMTEDEEGRLCYSTRNGIFSHMMGGSVVEQVVDGKLSSLSDPNVLFLGMAVLNQNFYVAVANGSETQLLRYEYDADVPSTPQKELNVYSLRESGAVRQAAVLFQKKYPDVYVNYKIGMTGDDGVTVSDALRTLNTDILAGNGPDVLILDEMSVDTYVRQGLLADLSDIVSEIQGSDGILENVARVYESDGILPAVPAKFGMLVAAGDPEMIGSVEGFDSLAGLAAQAGVLATYDVVSMGEILYRNCAGSWKNEDQTINQEKLSEFIKGVNTIARVYRENASEKTLEKIDGYQNGIYATWVMMDHYSSTMADDISLGILDLLSETKVKLGSLNSTMAYAGLCSINQKTGACKASLLSVQQSDVFLPYCVMGILNTAKEQESAKDFVKYMLSFEGQMQNKNNGFSVNVKSLEEEIYTNTYGIDDNGGYTVSSSQIDEEGMMMDIELTYIWPSVEELDALYEMAKQVSVAADLERVQHDVIIEELERCLNGEIGEDEAINTIMQKMNLYLAE